MTTTVATPTRSSSVTGYLILTFVLSWLPWGALFLLAPEGGLTNLPPGGYLLAFLGGYGPSLAALFMTGFEEGRPGVKALLRRLLTWRMGKTTYLVALTLVPVMTLIARQIMGIPLNISLGAVAFGCLWAINSSLGEEFGWRGYMLPRLQARYGPVTASLLVGLVWGMWHLLSVWFGTAKLWGSHFLLMFILLEPVGLTAWAFVSTWLYNRSGGSLLSSVLFHFSITSSAIYLDPALPVMSDTVRYTITAVTLNCLAALAVTIIGKSSRGASPT